MARCDLDAPPNEPENLDELEAQIHSRIVPGWHEKSANCEQQATFRVDCVGGGRRLTHDEIAVTQI